MTEGPRADSAAAASASNDPQVLEFRGGTRLLGSRLWIDPQRKVDLCYLSRPGVAPLRAHERILCSADTASWLKSQRGAAHRTTPLAPADSQTMVLASLRLTLVGSGLVRGNCAVYIEAESTSVLYAGDFDPAVLLANAASLRCAHLVVRAEESAALPESHGQTAAAKLLECTQTLLRCRPRVVWAADPWLLAGPLGACAAELGVGARALGAAAPVVQWGAVTPWSAARVRRADAALVLMSTAQAKRGQETSAVVAVGAPLPGAPFVPWCAGAQPREVAHLAESLGARHVYTTGPGETRLAWALRDLGLWARPLSAGRQLDLAL